MNILMETLSKLGFDWQLALVNFINVAIIFLLLKKFLFGKVAAFIEQRKKTIEEGIEHAKQAKTDLEMAEVRVNELLKEATQEANTIIEQAYTDAKTQADAIKAKNVEEIDMLIQEAKRKISAEKETMLVEAKKELAALVIAAVEKVVKTKMDKPQDKIFVEDIIKTL